MGGRLPADWEGPTRGTMMAWPALASLWGETLPRVREDITLLARTIAEYEPVTLLVRPCQVRAARRSVGRAVRILPIPVDDIWAGDTVPMVVEHPLGPYGVDGHFNGWGEKQQPHANDTHLARILLHRAGIRRVSAPLVMEGGCVDSNGQGTLMATESSLTSRNPRLCRDEIERALRGLFGAHKVIWLRGVRGQETTDCHIDMVARFLAPRVVALSRPAPGKSAVWWPVYRQARSALRVAADARGQHLDVIEIPEADPLVNTIGGPEVTTSYLTYYPTTTAVFVHTFGDPRADDRALGVLRDHHPNRDVVPLRLDAIAAGGGGLHCTTQHAP
ncbi:agmatine deiminase family protein [Allokutzneria oryzae]|uniref:Agmatine/peptidylarginine deiminase n=1 Tax=Allokutzneria oryzae TaxID=1378989 RepID=A0ABV6A317_9PSEU